MSLLEKTVEAIQPIRRDVMSEAQKRWNRLYIGMGDLGVWKIW